MYHLYLYISYIVYVYVYIYIYIVGPWEAMLAPSAAPPSSITPPCPPWREPVPAPGPSAASASQSSWDPWRAQSWSWQDDSWQSAGTSWSDWAAETPRVRQPQSLPLTEPPPPPGSSRGWQDPEPQRAPPQVHPVYQDSATEQPPAQPPSHHREGSGVWRPREGHADGGRWGSRGGKNNPNVQWHSAKAKAKREGRLEEFMRDNPQPRRR